MNVYFINSCRHIIILNIDDGEPLFLQPFETKSIVRNDSDVIKVFAKRDCESEKNSLMYYLVIETEYLFSGISDCAVFTITRENIRFSLNAYYDRLFLCTMNANCLSEEYKILAEDKIKKAFNKSQRVDFIIDTILTSQRLIIVLILVGILLTFIWGWRIAIIYFPLAFLFIGALNWLIDKFWSVISKKAFKIEDEKTEFYNYFKSDFIKSYYSNLNRTPFMGNVETD